MAAGYREHGFADEVAAFSQEMPDLMRRAHLVVCRAGASTLAELAAVGRAAILVPYPFAANNHQEFNARFLAAAGAAEIILNKDFTGEAFAGKINQFLAAPEQLANMEAASRQLAKPEAAREIVAGCVELMEKGARCAPYINRGCFTQQKCRVRIAHHLLRAVAHAKVFAAKDGGRHIFLYGGDV